MELIFVIVLGFVLYLAFKSRNTTEHDDFDKWESEHEWTSKENKE